LALTTLSQSRLLIYHSQGDKYYGDTDNFISLCQLLFARGRF